VLPAIEFNDQVCIGAKEIDNKSVDRKLSSKFPPCETAITQAKPKYALSVRLIAP